MPHLVNYCALGGISNDIKLKDLFLYELEKNTHSLIVYVLTHFRINIDKQAPSILITRKSKITNFVTSILWAVHWI